RKQTANVSTYTPESSRRYNYEDDDDDEEYSILLKDMPQISPSIALTPVSSIMELEDSLIMGNEELSTIPEKELDELINSNVKDLILIPNKSEDSSGSDKNIKSKDSYNLDEPTLLVTPLSKFNEDECFNPGDDVDEIEFVLHCDPSTPTLSVVSILEGFIDEPPLEENDDLFDLESKENEWKKILITLDFEDSRARGFVHRSLDLQSFACLYMGIRYPRSY
ncbi:hypothetical protein Tco_1423457, partial [Tanacetum coccineum]